MDVAEDVARPGATRSTDVAHEAHVLGRGRRGRWRTAHSLLDVADGALIVGLGQRRMWWMAGHGGLGRLGQRALEEEVSKAKAEPWGGFSKCTLGTLHHSVERSKGDTSSEHSCPVWMSASIKVYRMILWYIPVKWMSCLNEEQLSHGQRSKSKAGTSKVNKEQTHC